MSWVSETSTDPKEVQLVNAVSNVWKIFVVDHGVQEFGNGPLGENVNLPAW
jgi:hypothetical protein